MHELGIAEAALHAIEIEAARYPGTRVLRAGMRVGELAGVDGEALRFAFEAIKQGTTFEAMQLEIECCLRKQKCRDCGHEFVVAHYDLRCTAVPEFADRLYRRRGTGSRVCGG